MAWFRVRRGYLQLSEKPTKPPGPGGGNGNGNGNGENGNGEVEGITPEVPSIIPDPPPGIFPGPTPHMPILGPLNEQLQQTLPAGGVWPRPSDSPTPGTYVALAWLGERFGWRYIIIEPDAIQMPQIDRPGPPGTRR